MRIGKELIHSPETPKMVIRSPSARKAGGGVWGGRERGGKPALPQLQQNFLVPVPVRSLGKGAGRADVVGIGILGPLVFIAAPS